MQMHMLVERRAKPVLKRDRTKPRAGLSRRVTSRDAGLGAARL